MLFASEQFATKQLMEHRENVAQAVTDRQTDKQTDENVKQPQQHLRRRVLA